MMRDEYGGGRSMKIEAGIALDMLMTGQVLRDRIRKSGYTIRDIQEELKLSCPQPIYRWINGQTMPSIDNLYKLSRILNVHMEDLVLPRQDEVWIIQRVQNLRACRRMKRYYRTYNRTHHNKKRG